MAFLSAYHLKKQSRDPDVMVRVQNNTCKASEKMQYVNVKVHDNQLSPTAGTLQWPSVIAVDFGIESDSDSDSHA